MQGKRKRVRKRSNRSYSSHSSSKTMTLNKKKILIIAIMLISIISIIEIIINRNNSTMILTPEILRSKKYDIAKSEDVKVKDKEGKDITSVEFDAYFMKDLNGDGKLTENEHIRGACNEIGKTENLYMVLRVMNEGYVKDAKVTINSQNFKLKTSFLKDDMFTKDYISDNTKEFAFNELHVGAEKTWISSITQNVGWNDTSNLSKKNTIIFSGIYVDDDGNEYEFYKEVPIMVDWYGDVNCVIKTNPDAIYVDAMEQLVTEDLVTFDFDIEITENIGQLPLQESSILGTMPEINGYKPRTLEITGPNVTYTYDQETGKFTAKREAIINKNGVIKTNAYSDLSNGTRNVSYTFKVTYPKEAYELFGEEVKSIGFSIPIEAVNKAYNNPNEQFENPKISNTANGIVNILFKIKEIEKEDPSVSLSIGDYHSSTKLKNVISKVKPLNIYNNKAEKEIDDEYIVIWNVNTGTNGSIDKIVMHEPKDTVDSFQTNKNEYILMTDITTNKGIYFNGAINTLGIDGWIKVYDADTNTLIKEFNSSNWHLYSRSNPFKYESPVKHIKIETSRPNKGQEFYVYSIKELDDEYITKNFSKEEFDGFEYIKTNLYVEAPYTRTDESGKIEKEILYKILDDKASYIGLRSIANISVKDSYISTQETKTNEIITITTDTSTYNTEKWKNGTFLVQLPKEIMLAEINNITTTNENVKISAYDLYEENGNYYIKILTENKMPATYSIKIDCNLTPNPTVPRTTAIFNLYATNEEASDYYDKTQDVYDVDGDLNKEEEINYSTTSLTLETGSGLATIQNLSAYDKNDPNAITIAPRVAKTDKDQRSANIGISTTNNYTTGIKDINIIGVIPFAGNGYITTGKDMNSNYSTTITPDAIIPKDDNLKGHYKIYYSEQEKIPQELIEKSKNGTTKEYLENYASDWKQKDDVTDWTKIKSYVIVFDEEYELEANKKIEFEYKVNIPEGLNYNQISYAQHAVYYGLKTDQQALYYTYTAAGKIGLMISKQYDLEIIKYQKDKEKVIPGVTFALTQEGEETSSIRTTDETGKLTFNNLYAERYYTLKEIKTTDDYLLNGEEIRFYTLTKIIQDEQGNKKEEIYIVKDKDNLDEKLETSYNILKETNVSNADDKTKSDYKVQFKIENEPKAKLQITKTDKSTGEVLKNAKFKITGDGKDEIYTTDKNGKINISGLLLGKEYTLEEISLKDYYIPAGTNSKIKFTIINDNGKFKLQNFKDNGTTKDLEKYTQNDGQDKIIVNDEIPTLNLDLQNEKIPSYSLKLTKYAKGEKTADGNDKTLAKAQYQIFGEGISEKGKIYQTDENGVLTIDNLYEYVQAKDNENYQKINGEYTLKEIYAPEGYSVNTTEFKFKTYRENGTLKLDILSEESIIRTITLEDSSTKQDLNITNAESSNSIIEIGVEDAQIFSMFKYTEDGKTSTKVPIKGTKFKITDLEGNYIKGTDGKIVGELDEKLGCYALTTDENGKFTANLPEGYYKAIEVYAGEKYDLPEYESDRTYYFAIGSSKAASYDWIKNAVLGKGWNYINSIVSIKDGGVIAVGSFSDYAEDMTAGIDVNNDGNMDKISQGNDDGLIICYDEYGKYKWSKYFGGEDDDSLNKIIQTKDGGYMAVRIYIKQ